MKKIINKIINKVLMNWNRPYYSKNLFIFCSRYIDFCYGDNNFDRKTNGENAVIDVIVPRCRVMFDVGANDGKYSSYVLSVNPEVKIHAFEPGKIAFDKLNKLPITTNNLALGDKKETRTLYCDMSRSTHNSFYNFGNTDETQEVIVETIDNYCHLNKINHIDFLKIDVEGYEFLVLLGAERMFKTGSIDYIQFEFSGATQQSRNFLKDFIDFFNKYNYDLYRIKPKTIEKVVYSPAKERFTLTNYLAIKRTIPILPKLHAKDYDF